MLKNHILTLIKGVTIGGTMLVPGVSGGSMAIILGIYNKLISSISSFMKHKRESFFFLFIFCIGAACGMALLAQPLLGLIDAFPLPTLYFFIGAVAGGVPMICGQAKIKAFSWKVPLYILLGAGAVLALSIIPANTAGNQVETGVFSFLLLVLSGFIAAIASILPGISVSYLLLLIGLYDETIQAIESFYLPFLVPLVIGLAAGIVISTKLLEKVMSQYPQPTYLIILGFIFGSIINIFPGIPSLGQLPVCLITFTAGFAAIYTLSRKELAKG